MSSRAVVIGHFAEENHREKILTNEETVENTIIERLEDKLNGKPWTTDAVAYILYKPQGPSAPPGIKMIQDTLKEMNLPAANIHTETYRATGGALADTRGPKGKIVVDWTKRIGGGNRITYYMQDDTPVWHRDYDEDGNACDAQAPAEEECG